MRWNLSATLAVPLGCNSVIFSAGAGTGAHAPVPSPAPALSLTPAPDLETSFSHSRRFPRFRFQFSSISFFSDLKTRRLQKLGNVACRGHPWTVPNSKMSSQG